MAAGAAPLPILLRLPLPMFIRIAAGSAWRPLSLVLLAALSPLGALAQTAADAPRAVEPAARPEVPSGPLRITMPHLAADEVAAYLDTFQEHAKADELMVSLQSSSHEEVIKNMQLLAQGWQLDPARVAGTPS